MGPQMAMGPNGPVRMPMGGMPSMGPGQRPMGPGMPQGQMPQGYGSPQAQHGMPGGHQMPPGHQLPPGHQMPSGHQLPPGHQMPPGQQHMPPGRGGRGGMSISAGGGGTGANKKMSFD